MGGGGGGGGGIFERMIKSAKCCLKKSVGRASLTYDGLALNACDLH